MKLPLSLVLIAFIAPVTVAETASDPVQLGAAPALAQSGDSINLDEFLWKFRPLIIFSDSPDDPRFVRQMQLLETRRDDLVARDVVIVTDTDPAAHTPLREKLRPRGFSLILMGKDGTVYLRKPLPWDTREISRSIDKLPIRRQEIRDRRLTPPK